MYRAVGWKAIRDGVPLDNEAAVAALAERSRIDVSSTAITIDDVDVTRAIRTPEIDRAAAAVARLPRVRGVLVDRQRQLGAGGGIVMEGRDIGTVVFPDADVKVYLDASPGGARAPPCRRSRPHRSPRRGVRSRHAPHPARRAGSDAHRSPLFAAKDAVIVDTTGKSVDEVVEEVMAVVAQGETRAEG